MTGIDVSVSRELLPGLLGSQDGLAKLAESVLNQMLEAQVTTMSLIRVYLSVAGNGRRGLETSVQTIKIRPMHS